MRVELNNGQETALLSTIGGLDITYICDIISTGIKGNKKFTEGF
jgi:hypothetical protein